MKKVILIEEVPPEAGHTKQQIESSFWNSPPSLKGEGRYFIAPRSDKIDKENWKKLKAVYWDREFLEEADMFFTPPGWRVKASAIEILKQAGYEVEVITLEQQKKEAEERKRKRQEERERELQKRKELEEKFEKEVEEFEKLLGVLSWREPQEGDKTKKGGYTHTIALQDSDRHVSYTLTENNHIYKTVVYNYDFWSNFVSNEPVSEEGLAFFMQKQRELEERIQKQKQEYEERQKQRIAEIKQAVEKMLQRTSWEEIETELKRRKIKRFCPKELTVVDESGKRMPKYGDFTIEELKKIYYSE